MTRVRAGAQVPGPVDAVRELWWDLGRRPSFVDGFARVVRVDADWPQAGRLVWDSLPRGRGRVVETAHGPDAVAVEDRRLAGVERVRFEPAPGGSVRVDVELEYRLKDRTPLTPLVDLLFVRRAMADSLWRTLRRFEIERRADAWPEASGRSGG